MPLGFHTNEVVLLAPLKAAVRVFEDDKTFNIGRGSMLNAEGEVTVDAALMDGENLRLGALGAAQGLRHPISVAHKILDVVRCCWWQTACDASPKHKARNYATRPN